MGIGATATLGESEPWNPETGVKIVLIVLGILVVGGSLFADYKWRQWMASRRRERDQDDQI